MDKRICGIVRHCTITGSIEKDPDAGKDGRQRRGQQRIRRWDGITNSTDMNLGELQEMVRDRETWSV